MGWVCFLVFDGNALFRSTPMTGGILEVSNGTEYALKQ